MNPPKLLNEIGNMLREQKDYGKALEIYKVAIDMMRQLLAHGEANKLPLAILLSNTGCVYEETHAYEEAFLYYKEAYDIRKKFLSGEHKNVASTLVRLGYVCLQKDVDDLAEKYIEEAVGMCRRHDYNTILAAALKYRGKLYLKQCFFNSALGSFQDALHIEKQLPDASLANRADLLDHIGDAYLKLERQKDALEAFMEARQVLK